MSFIAHEAAHLDPAALERARRRSRWILFASVALGSTGYIAASTVGALAGQALLGTAALAGAPGAAIVFGAALGAVCLSWIMARRGRRMGLASGYLFGVLGAALGVWAMVSRSFPLLLLAMFLIGFGNASGNLSRYTAADLVEPKRRAVAIGGVVWGSTIGGIIGPLIVRPANDLALTIGLPLYAGAFLVPIVFVAAAAALGLAFLRPDPYALAYDAHVAPDPDRIQISVREILLRPSVLGALAALIAGQATMVLIMTITPVHLGDHGHGLDVVGFVISAHVMGMFALAPISGRITQRFGAFSTILLGTVVLVAASLLAAVAPPERSELLLVALFLLGWGWNLGFVAGSTMLTTGLGLAERTRVQGVADAVIWTTSAAASLGSGAVVAAAGFSTLGLLGVGLVLAPIWLLLNGRRAMATAADS